MTKKTNTRMMIVAAILTVGWFLISASSKSLYANVDNFNISIIISGLFGRDTYTYYLHPWLCSLLNVLSNIFNDADMYVVLMHTLLMITLCVLFYLILQSDLSNTEKIVFIAIIYVLLVQMSLYNCNFTIHAALFTLAGAEIIITRENKETMLRFIAILLLCFGFMWRLQGALLMIPFILLDIIADLIKSKDYRMEIRLLSRRCVLSIAVILMVVLSQTMVNNSDRYKEGISYSQARSKIEDFPVREWNEIENQIDNVSEKEYRAAIQWELLDTEVITTDLMEKISEVGSKNKYDTSFSGIKCAVGEMLNFIMDNKSWTFFVGSIVLFSLWFILKLKNKQIDLMKCIFACVGAGIILLYFTIKGRAILHIWISVVLGLIFVILKTVFQNLLDIKDRKQFQLYRKLLLFICIGGLLFSLVRCEWHIPINVWECRKEKEDLIYLDYQGDELYIWCQWHQNITQLYMDAGKLPTQEFMDHNISAGDWTYGQKYFCEHLSKIGAENPAKALLERKNTYLVADDCRSILSYLREEYGEHISVSQVDKIEGIPVWKFES